MKSRQIVHTILLISEILLYLSILIIAIIGCVQKKNIEFGLLLKF